MTAARRKAPVRPRIVLDQLGAAPASSDEVLVDVWHARELSFIGYGADVPEAIDRAQYVHVATFRAWLADSKALEEAWMLSQNIDASWMPGSRVRSSSVGDVFVVRKLGQPGEPHRVAVVGFQPISAFVEFA